MNDGAVGIAFKFPAQIIGTDIKPGSQVIKSNVLTVI